MLVAALSLGAQPASIRPATPGLNEAGVPFFAITSPASLGLSSPPTDLQPLPDGRILALADRELAVGDATRWEVFSLAGDDTAARSSQVAIAADGQIYTGIPAGIARLEFQADGNLHRVPIAHTPNPLMLPTTAFKAGERWY